MPTAGAPAARDSHRAVWTGRRMLVWSGQESPTGADLATGGRYDPDTDTWSPLSIPSLPTARRYTRAIWTGREMIIWGGHADAARLNTGGVYAP